MNEKLTVQLRKEAARNAQMQGDKEHQTNQRRKTFRYRNHMFLAAADCIDKLDEIPCYFSWWLDDSTHNCQTAPIPDTPCPACKLKTLEKKG